MGCTMSVAKRKALISCAFTAQLICAFVFAYAKNRFSHVVGQIMCSLSVQRKKIYYLTLPQQLRKNFHLILISHNTKFFSKSSK